GDAFSCAEVRAAGGDLGVWCWGQSDLGRLGTASAFVSSQSTPAAVPGLAAVTQGGLVAGYTDACAIETDFNSYKCWGENGAHQISDQAASITSPSFLLNGGGANPGEAMIGNGLICRIGHGNPGTYPDTYCLGTNDVGQIGRGHTGFDSGYGTRVTQ
ncbi:MAG TPA: hypothetical protein VFI13_04515, partial [Gemmatimonadales bacterium]|nr:hypothetical protein [Gemmatimonadales bacterium]